jgi:uncharacterized protein DUF202
MTSAPRGRRKMDASAVSGQGVALSDYLAAERTLLAWIRTGLALMGFGFIVARFGFVPETTSNCPARFFSAALRSVAVVWNHAHSSWGGAESILRVASPSTNRDHGSGPRDAPSHYDSSCTYIHVPGPSWDRNDDLSDFSSRLCAFPFWK